MQQLGKLERSNVKPSKKNHRDFKQVVSCQEWLSYIELFKSLYSV